MTFFLFFPHKTGLTFHTNGLQGRKFAWNVKPCGDNLYEMPQPVFRLNKKKNLQKIFKNLLLKTCTVHYALNYLNVKNKLPVV